MAKLALSIASLTLLMLACGPSEPPKMGPAKTDGVAANSASEDRLASSSSSSTATAKPAPAPTDDPAAPQPYMTPMGSAAPAGSSSSTSTPSGKGGKGGKPGKGTAALSGGGAGGEKATAAECKQAMDKAIDIMISSDPRFAGIPPEMLSQIKEQALGQAKGQAGGDPCAKGDMTKAQYTCAMSAASSPAVQACLK